MRSMRSAQRQVEIRRLGNPLPVLGKADSLGVVGNISLQPGTSMRLKLCRPLFLNTRSPFDRACHVSVCKRVCDLLVW